ncbi:MAG: hypothetical protein ACTHJ5_11435, partial [Ilyomonas sp.]
YLLMRSRYKVLSPFKGLFIKQNFFLTQNSVLELVDLFMCDATMFNAYSKAGNKKTIHKKLQTFIKFGNVL